MATRKKKSTGTKKVAHRKAGRPASKRSSAKRTSAKKRWSQGVTEHSDALDLDSGVFTRSDPKSIARSLKRSAEKSQRRKSTPFRSAMSMITFYENRGGKTLSKRERATLDQAKVELRRLFGKD